MSKRSFFKGAAILAAAGMAVKVLGFLFRIPLGRIIGSGGMGDYAPAYDVYSFILVIATAGIPVAISKLVSERYATGRYGDAENVFRVSRRIMWILGIAGFVILFLGADIIASAIKIESSALAIRAISPALLLAPIMSSYRGYFQGMQQMMPTAVSQIAEQLFRVIAGLSCSYVLYKGIMFGDAFDTGSPADSFESKGAAGATFGAAVGALFGLIMVMVSYRMRKSVIDARIGEGGSGSEDAGDVARKIIKIAMPITIAACIMPLVNLADITIVMRRLTESGYAYETAKSMFGELTSFAAPIIGFPQILIQAIAVSVVPQISGTNEVGTKDDMSSDIGMGYKTAMLIALPCSWGMFVLAEPILLLFYGDQIDNAWPCLMIYAVSFIFLSVTNITTAMLQGLGKQNVPVRNLFIGVIVKICVTWMLSGVRDINVKGAAFGTLAAYITAALLDMIALKKFTGVKLEFMDGFIKPFISSAIMGALVFLSFTGFTRVGLGSGLATLLSIIVGVLFYALALFKGGLVTEEELLMMPMGRKLSLIYRKLNK